MWQLHLNVEVCVGKEKLNLGFAAVGGGYVIHWWPRGKNPVHFSFLCFFFSPFPFSFTSSKVSSRLGLG